MELHVAKKALNEKKISTENWTAMGEAWEIEIDLDDLKGHQQTESKAIDLTFTMDGTLIAHHKRLKNCPSSFCLIHPVEITDATPEGLQSYIDSL